MSECVHHLTSVPDEGLTLPPLFTLKWLIFPLSLLRVAGRKVVLGNNLRAPNYWDFLSARKLSIPYTSYRCVSHPPNDKLKLTNPWEHHIALSLLWPHGSPIPLNTYTSWWRGVTAFTLKQWIPTDHPSLPTIPVFPCVVWTTLGYYPEPISLTNLPYLPEYVDPRCPSRQWLRLVSWWVTRWVFGWQCCSARDKAPHTTTPILWVTTTEPQTPGTGHKKWKLGTCLWTS